MLYNLLDQEVAPRLRFWSDNPIFSGQPLVIYSTSFSPDSSKEIQTQDEFALPFLKIASLNKRTDIENLVLVFAMSGRVDWRRLIYQNVEQMCYTSKPAYCLIWETIVV